MAEAMKFRALTDEDLAGKQWRNSMHMNLGGGSYGYGYRSVLWPRCGYLDFGYRGKRAEKEGCASRRVWTLDGAPVDSKEAMMAGHAEPPVLTEREQKVLDLMPDEFAPLRETEKRISEALGDPPPEQVAEAQKCATDVMALGAKGLVEIDRVRDETSRMAGGPLDHLAYKSVIRRRRL